MAALPVRLRRPALHAACVAFALLYRWFTPRDAILLAAAACVFNLIFMPALAPSLYRQGEKPVTSGIFIYPLMVLLMSALLPLHVAASCWAMMALGDAAASALGRGPKWPWGRKTIIGSASFFIAAGLGASFLWWWTARAAPPWMWIWLATLLAALVESLPLPIDDNITVPAVGAALLGRWAPAVAISLPGLAVSVALGAAALALRLLTVSGAVAGVALATMLYSFGTWRAFVLLAAFFVIGSGATRVAYARKQAMGLAERRKGARTAEQAIANAGAAVAFAFLGWPIAMTASLAAAAADTIATEIGPLTGSRVFLLANGKDVRPGTSGGISIAGTMAGIVAAAAVSAIAVLIGAIPSEHFAVVTMAAVTGSAVDSLLGGTLEKRGFLNNEGVNFLGTLAAGLIAMGML